MMRIRNLILVASVTACSGGLSTTAVTKLHDAQQDCELIYERDEAGDKRALARGCICSNQAALAEYDAGLFVTPITCTQP
jgi:hypothetical protein